MITIEVEGVQHQMISNWDELTLEIYIQVLKMEENKSKMEEYIQTLKLVEVMCGREFTTEISEDFDMSTQELLDISARLEWFGKQPDIVSDTLHFIINGRDYAIGKMIDMRVREKLFIENSIIKTDNRLSDYTPALMATLLRPATLHIKPESGREVWKQEKFSMEDLEDRIQIFNKHLTYPVMKIIFDSFLVSSKS